MFYLDNAATTSMSESVFSAMKPYMCFRFANPESIYSFGREAADAIQRARETVAAFVHADSPEQIIFTSGGTESNATALYQAKNYTKIFRSGAEHDSVIENSKENSLSLPLVNNRVSVDDLENYLKYHCSGRDTVFVSAMYVNNETGDVNPVGEIGDLCADYNVKFHTDCVQAAGYYDLDVRKIGCDFMSISSHKIHGPKGVGALYVRDVRDFDPMIKGGHNQEFGMRGGTANVSGIVGFAAACNDFMLYSEYIRQRVNSVYDAFKDKLIRICSDIHINAGEYKDGPCKKILNVAFDGVDSQSLLLMLESHEVFASAGSACRSHDIDPSPALIAMGYSPERAMSSVRFSFSEENELSEVTKAATIVADCVKTIRGI